MTLFPRMSRSSGENGSTMQDRRCVARRASLSPPAAVAASVLALVFLLAPAAELSAQQRVAARATVTIPPVAMVRSVSGPVEQDRTDEYVELSSTVDVAANTRVMVAVSTVAGVRDDEAAARATLQVQSATGEYRALRSGDAVVVAAGDEPCGECSVVVRYRVPRDEALAATLRTVPFRILLSTP